MKQKTIINIYYYIIFLISSAIIVSFIGITMPDDGWRHLAMALYPEQIKSWGEVYPHTLYNDYDPWFMWHNLLSSIHNFVETGYIHIVVNSLIYSFLSFWYYLAFNKFTKLSIVFIIIFSVGLPLLTMRYFFLRPDALSGLFILYFLILRNKILLTIISCLYAPYYYVFWFHMGYLIYVQSVLKEYKNILILIFAILFGFSFYAYIDFKGFIEISTNVLNNDTLTGKYSVGESNSYLFSTSFVNLIGSSKLLVLMIIISLLFIYVFKPKTLLTKIFILYFPLMILQFRFLHLLQPIFYLYLISIIYNNYRMIKLKGIIYFINNIKLFIQNRTYFGNLTYNGFKTILIITLILFFTLTYLKVKSSSTSLERHFKTMTFLNEKEFRNKKILFSTMSTETYMALFINPTGKYVPSCSLGWVKYDEKDKKTYFNLLINNEEISMKDFFIFLKLNSPDYFIINTASTSNLIFTEFEIMNNGYSFYKIINSKLIFRKNKN